ncbi:hypothetical protein BpHYR1_018481 [Brachionus plicatilis]|uniref:Uncharacterized protein n=1 Tax=Brachionus plicatilis TaxID=10195 RepID=A0A3M7RG78_BRAPC|nr:hypothetical protein BpHYR1_018481 [Brachionus plicatilis]
MIETSTSILIPAYKATQGQDIDDEIDEIIVSKKSRGKHKDNALFQALNSYQEALGVVQYRKN